ncbi:MAG: hypothetical protein RLZZ458_2792, partial [Planctomycetota bacterium]
EAEAERGSEEAFKNQHWPWLRCCRQNQRVIPIYESASLASWCDGRGAVAGRWAGGI